jgi:hypothetical protein
MLPTFGHCVVGYPYLKISQKSFYVGCLMMLSVLTLDSIRDRMINECGTVGGMRICREIKVLRENPPQSHFIHHKFHMI